MRADSHSPDHDFSLQNSPQLYNSHHDIIPTQHTTPKILTCLPLEPRKTSKPFSKNPSSSTKQSRCFSLIYPTNRGVETGQVLTEVSLEDVDLSERSCELRL